MTKQRLVLVLALALALAVIALVMRTHNALHYFPLFGFDALFHWRYVEALLETGRLPDPESAWSASRPPLFFLLAAAITRALGRPETPTAVVGVRLVSSAIGVLPALLAARLVLRVDPGRPLRAVLAAALVLFVPAHLYMSAMFNEEILVASLGSLALYGACRWHAVGIGIDKAVLGEERRPDVEIALARQPPHPFPAQGLDFLRRQSGPQAHGFGRTHEATAMPVEIGHQAVDGPGAVEGHRRHPKRVRRRADDGRVLLEPLALEVIGAHRHAVLSRCVFDWIIGLPRRCAPTRGSARRQDGCRGIRD